MGGCKEGLSWGHTRWMQPDACVLTVHGGRSRWGYWQEKAADRVDHCATGVDGVVHHVALAADAVQPGVVA